MEVVIRKLCSVMGAVLSVVSLLLAGAAGAETLGGRGGLGAGTAVGLPSLVPAAAAAATAMDDGSSVGADGVQFAMTPRVWITQVNVAEADEYDPGAYFIPMYGGSVEIGFPSSGFSILATGLYGEGEADAESVVLGSGDAEATRADVELLLRYRVPDSPVIVFAGPRYVNFDQEVDIPGRDIENQSHILIGELGLGVFGNIDERGNHRFFANLIAGVAVEYYEFENGFAADEEDDVVVGGSVDLNVGYEYLVTNWASVNLRYRSFLLFGEDDFSQSDITTVHGPEVGVAFRF